MDSLPFAGRVSEAMRRGGVTLRQLCRDVGLDASFFSKVLSGKRSPPAEEEVLRRVAERLGLDPAELVVAAGRIPAEWQGLWRDPELFRGVHALAANGEKGFTAEGAEESAEGKKGKELRSRKARETFDSPSVPQRPSASSASSAVRRFKPFTSPQTPPRLPEAADLDTELL